MNSIKRIPFFLLVGFCCFFIFLGGKNQSTASIDSLNKQAHQILSENRDHALQYAQQALQMAEEQSYVEGAATAHMRLGVIYRDMGDFVLAQNHLFQAVDILTANPGLERTYIKVEISLGNLYLVQQMYDDCLLHYEKAKTLIEETGFAEYLNFVEQNTALVLEQKKEYKKAKNIYLSIYSRIDEEYGVKNRASLMLNIGSVLYSSIEPFYSQKRQNELADSSLLFTHKASEYFIEVQDSVSIAKCIQNELLVAEFYNDYSKSLALAQKGLKISRALDEDGSAQAFLQSIMMAYIYLNQPSKAEQYFHKAETLEDSINQQNLDELIVEKEKKYQLAEKENELLQEKINRASIEEKYIFNRKIVLGLIVVSALILALALASIKNYRKKQTIAKLELESKNTEIENLIQEHEIEIYTALLEGQEKERQRVAADLHDRIGGLLAAVKLQFSGGQGINAEKANQIKRLIDESIGTVRSISHDLADGRVDKMGLSEALLHLKENLLSAGKMKFDVFLEQYPKGLSIAKEKVLFKIVLELISNTLKHANATTITLQINAQNGDAHVAYEDDGSGFDVKKQVRGMGLDNIENRVKKLKGTWVLDSKLNRGTSVIINFPIA